MNTGRGELDAKQVAGRLGVSLAMVYRYMKCKGLPWHKKGSGLRAVWSDDLDMWMQGGFMNPKARAEAVERQDADAVNHPEHYTWIKDRLGIEVIDITRCLSFSRGNAVKYLLRAGHKAEQGMTAREKELEDLRKAAFYVNDEIRMIEESMRKDLQKRQESSNLEG